MSHGMSMSEFFGLTTNTEKTEGRLFGYKIILFANLCNFLWLATFQDLVGCYDQQNCDC